MRTYPDSVTARAALVRQGDAEWLLPIAGRKPVKLIANDAIMAGFDAKVFDQAVNMAELPGVEQVIISPDSHVGFGCPVGCTTISRDVIYPPVVGPDISCSVSSLQTDLPRAALDDRSVRRTLIEAILQRIPTGVGARMAPKARRIPLMVCGQIITHGADDAVLSALGIPAEWGHRLENRSFGSVDQLGARLMYMTDVALPSLRTKVDQLGSLGGGNHFVSCDYSTVSDTLIGDHFGLVDGAISFLTHCGSRGFGYQLAAHNERVLQSHFDRWGLPFPDGDRHLVYAPVDSREGQDYLMDMAMGANFAVVNHLLINAYLLEAVQEVFPGTKGELVYWVAHNVGQQEIVDSQKRWVFRKGATRAFPAGHPALKDTRYAGSGHPILLPGNARDGSYVMVANTGAAKNCHTVSHGGGRAMGRKDAKRRLVQAEVEQDLLDHDVLYNGRSYPLDESPGAYKDFDQVTASVVSAGLASVVAKLTPRFVIKDNDQSVEGSA